MDYLIIKLEGQVIESNLAQWQEKAISEIREAGSKELVTDQDFAWAEETATLFKAREKALKSAKEEALKQNADIEKLFQAIDAISADIAAARLNLERQVKKEKEARKEKIVADAIDFVAREVMAAWPEGSPWTKYDWQVNQTVIKAAVVGKKTIAGMQKAIDMVARAEIQAKQEMFDVATKNYSIISAVEAELPGLFPDKKGLSMRPSAEVSAIIDARVADFRLKQKEKAEREAAAQKPSTQQPETTSKTEQEAPPVNDQVPTHTNTHVAPKDAQISPQAVQPKNKDRFAFTVIFECDTETATKLAREFSAHFGDMQAVVSMDLKRTF